MRVVRGRVAPGRETDFVEACRQTVVERARSPGLVAFFPGYRRVSGAERFVLASTWASADHANRSAGPPDDATVSKILSDVAEIESLDVFNALQPSFGGLVDAPGGVIRLVSAYLAPGQRSRLDAWLTGDSRAREPLQLSLGWAIGERQVDGRTELIGLSAWPSQLVVEALADAGGQSGLLFAGAREFVTDVAVESYQAIGLELPSDLSDVTTRRVLAARFAEREPADVAAADLSACIPSAAQAPVSVAPLGAPGTASDVRAWIMVARVSAADYPRAERLVTDHGGAVILATREVVSDVEEAASLGGPDPDQSERSTTPAN